jgi:hypothetical protein
MRLSKADVVILGIQQGAIRRFWRNVDKRSKDECWPWKLSTQKNSGHGVFSIKHVWCFAHRVSFFLANGYLPDKEKSLLVIHDCENPICCNPNHLLEGTPTDNGNYPGCVAKCRANIRDRSWFGSRGKDHPRWGMKHSEETKVKLRAAAIKRGGWHKGLKRTAETKKRISLVTRGENSGRAKLTDAKVRAILSSNLKNVELARLYGVDPSIVSLVRSRKIWAHIFID